jgi:hypothetical protein
MRLKPRRFAAPFGSDNRADTLTQGFKDVFALYDRQGSFRIVWP